MKKNVEYTIYRCFDILKLCYFVIGLFVLTLSLMNDPERYSFLTLTFSLKPLIV